MKYKKTWYRILGAVAVYLLFALVLGCIWLDWSIMWRITVSDIIVILFCLFKEWADEER